ncbi:phospholipase A2 inhibitor and Ly6/PLAUR domain-containing protein-like [Hyperolius riggenbachi]|uniref:phospholipase A2 inhibitor and Ly6/PLAUR domain-containing protein-like n=1 Tax=Hyperolius riggenbachi TaxID=752182 RepID=UPI0035A31C7F
MRWVLGTTLLLSVYLGTGQAVKCLQCTSYDDIGCSVSPTDCLSSSDVCATTIVRNRGFRYTGYYFIRSCVSASECLNNGRVTGLYTETAFNTSCCPGDGCNTGKPALPKLNLTLNGLLCPAYATTDMEPCDIKNVSACTGNQTRCIRYSTSTKFGPLGSRKSMFTSNLYLGGCTTESVCTSDKSYISADGVSFETKRTCYNSASSLQARTLVCGLPILLLLLKAFLGSCISV